VAVVRAGLGRQTEALEPTAADLAAWLKLDPGTEGLDEAVSAALEAQRAHCVWETYTDALRVAALRRAAREYSARAFPLGFMDAGEFGLARVGRDYLIAELEADYRRGGFDTAGA
jgi:hypothetical protein